MRQSGRRLFLTNDTAETVSSLHPQIKQKIRAAFRSVLADPLVGKALKDELEGLRSFRVSRMRIIYRIVQNNVIEVVTVGPRKTIYEDTLRLLKKNK